jgi:nucleotide-binding universal stress UspA family protein
VKKLESIKQMMNTDQYKILVPTDFSEESTYGFQTALELAGRIDAEITLLHMIPEPGPEGFRPAADMEKHNQERNENIIYINELLKKRKQQMHEFVEAAKEQSADIKTIIDFGLFSDKLEDFLEHHDIDLIVMGTTGEKSFQEKFTGNHTAKAIRIAEIPVLAVKQNEQFGNRDKILLLVDLKDYDHIQVRRIKRFTEVLDMKVFIGHIIRKKDAISGNIEEQLTEFGEQHRFKDFSTCVFGAENKVQSVRKLINQENMDLVATISEGNSGLMRLFFGSDTEDFVNKLNKPVLAVSE